ncbi:LEAF RUST 10 DISEASE-RESISTANCE LOCUS RECEPTOR-LIKE PROTEIN KINASE-like 1.1 [Glycine max]|nr:LEAF RUST 10 DISEASE-RESISTANCE LOCUS RECEPTOR-LIKE PROTEIN KINASE-like 1.1 [Glycine max]
MSNGIRRTQSQTKFNYNKLIQLMLNQTQIISFVLYLHTSNIIHRDVKTNNILLDISVSTKVPDFGLSRLLPNDVSHVSTAPQGSLGYLDPQYFQLYRFKDKSDVYSFGVVLIELISSMVADDAARERYQANLANLTMKKMQKVKLSELVDPFFGFESDQVVKRILTSVVGLAFRCMQGDNELSPSMDEVLEALNKFQNENYESENREKEDNDGVISSTSSTKVHPPQPASQDSGQVGILMNNKLLRSPNSLTEKLEGWYVDLELATRVRIMHI